MTDCATSPAVCVPSLGLAGQVLTAVQQTAVVVSQELVAKNTYRMRLRCPDVARQIVPGQFFMLRSPHDTDPLLGRPFALLDVVVHPEGSDRSKTSEVSEDFGSLARDATDQNPADGSVARDDHSDGEPAELDFGYVVVGKFTGLLSTLVPGAKLEIWGPLGNGFPVSDGGHLAIVAGGIGQTPFVAVLREALGRLRYGRDPGATPRRVTVCYGARNREFLAGVEWFTSLGVDVRVSTDDGSVGHRGYVTELLQQLLTSDDPPTRVLCCGPEPMMRAVARLTGQHDVPCWLSLETPMACGFGACFSCVTKIRQDDGGWDYRRVCVEGPVFPAELVVFD